MVNNALGSHANLSTLLAQSVNNANQTSVSPSLLTGSDLQAINDLQTNAPKITDGLLSQLNNETLDMNVAISREIYKSVLTHCNFTSFLIKVKCCKFILRK